MLNFLALALFLVPRLKLLGEPLQILSPSPRIRDDIKRVVRMFCDNRIVDYPSRLGQQNTQSRSVFGKRAERRGCEVFEERAG